MALPYVPTEWKSGDLVSSTRLNKLEGGVKENSDAIVTNTADVNQLKSEINEVEAGFPQKSASGSIVTIEDGADNVPVVSLTAEINPVQNLHGYDNPWPAGGNSNNILPLDITRTVYGITFEETATHAYRMHGVTTQKFNTTYIVGSTTVSVPLVLKASTSYLFKISCPNTEISESMASAYLTITLADDSTVDVNVNTPFTLEQDSKAVIVRCVTPIDFGNRDIGTLYDYTVYPQITVGSSSSAWTPYENTCPISGFTGANVFDTGVNQFNKATVTDNAYVNNSGVVVTPSSEFFCSDYIPCVPSESYYTNADVNNRMYNVQFFDVSKTYIGGTLKVNTTFTTPSNCRFFRVNGIKTHSDPNTMVVNYPATDHEYHAYTGRIVNITFPDAADTVYGGTLVLNQDGTADLTVTHGGHICDGTEGVTESVSTNGFMVIARNQNVFMDAFAVTEFVSVVPICSHYKGVDYDTGSNLNIGDCDTYKGADGKSIGFKTVFNEPSEFQSWLAAQYAANTPLTFVLPLVSPVTYHIEDVDLVKTLYGMNNIWADTGDVSLTYRCDPATFTSEQIRIMLNAMVAPVEATNVASKAYSVNDFLILDNVLYKVISPISNGGTITINTNVSATTIGAEITSILNS